ncbi:MAG: hypothetical protein KAW09_02855 [Thermoplasmata archaeon]|nr:hypothetical protein [Thermoplasmata archaeon]
MEDSIRNDEEEDESSRIRSDSSEKHKPFGGFAQAVSALKKLNQLESDIATIISSCRVPVREARKFLRCSTPEQVANISLFQYMRALFMQLGIDIEVSQIEPYAYFFVVKQSAISDLYSSISGHTCHLVCEAIARFFIRDLYLSCSVDEIRCVNAGDKACEFEAIVNKGDYCRIAFSNEEKELLKELARSDGAIETPIISWASPEELEFRLFLFKEFDLVDEGGKVTELGVKCSTQPIEEEDLESPWKEMGDLTSAISSAVSFAEASHLSVPPDSQNSSHESEPLDQSKVKGYRSFAELLAKQVDKESESEGF